MVLSLIDGRRARDRVAGDDSKIGRRLDHFGHPLIACDEACTAAARKVEPDPLDEHDRLTPEVDQEQNVYQCPKDECEVAAKVKAADLRPRGFGR